MTVKVPKVNRIANFINNSPKTQGVLKNINDNPSWYSALATAGFTMVLRPGTMLATSKQFKSKEDRNYSIASSISAGLTEVAASAALFLPLNKCIKTASDNLYTSESIYKNNAPLLRNFKSLTNRMLKIGFLIPISLIRFGLVKPVVKTVFGGKHENK